MSKKYFPILGSLIGAAVLLIGVIVFAGRGAPDRPEKILAEAVKNFFTLDVVNATTTATANFAGFELAFAVTSKLAPQAEQLTGAFAVDGTMSGKESGKGSANLIVTEGHGYARLGRIDLPTSFAESWSPLLQILGSKWYALPDDWVFTYLPENLRKAVIAEISDEHLMITKTEILAEKYHLIGKWSGENNLEIGFELWLDREQRLPRRLTVTASQLTADTLFSYSTAKEALKPPENALPFDPRSLYVGAGF